MLSKIHFVYQENVVSEPNESLTHNIPNVNVENTIKNHWHLNDF